ncbi:hypothetical protein F5883DRAFT_619221 [Diaporthe sp. PMI_573]|nr:hypothetical protein F5883DRAFT_619221 [Diaporthaceae sp. PMI_573]
MFPAHRSQSPPFAHQRRCALNSIRDKQKRNLVYKLFIRSDRSISVPVRGVVCGGYETQLRWGTGIASRGQFTGASAPLEDAISQRPKGRRRDLLKAGRRAALGREPDLSTTGIHAGGIDGTREPHSETSSPSAGEQNSSECLGTLGGAAEAPVTVSDCIDDEALFQEFLESGHQVLYSTKTAENFISPALTQLSERSQALFTLCVAVQCFLSGRMEMLYQRYDSALAKFRIELESSGEAFKDTTIAAGLLLCTLGMLQGVPWSMHLSFIDELFVKSVEKEHFRSLTPYGHHAVETLGVMDLPTFVIGRQPLSRGIWRRYRQCQPVCQQERTGGVEPVSGLPRSLLDLFSRIEEPNIEIDFQLWPGETGEYLQCQLWEAYRLAGVLMAKRLRLGEACPNTPDTPPEGNNAAPNTHAYVHRLFSALEAVWLGSAQAQTGGSLVMNAFLYPAFRYHDHSSKNAWDFLQGFSAAYEQEKDFRNLSNRRGLEISLL